MKDFYSGSGKRILDVFFSGIALLVSTWILLLITLLYILSFQFPVLFISERIGSNEKPFKLIKFRTLKSQGSTLQNRRFWLGDALRFTSLDELPQLWNVLKGDMSLIGPRPLPVEYLPLFSVEQRRRHAIRPGITGWAQVNGRHSISWKKKFELDLFYVNKLSFSLDMEVFIKTMLLILSFKKDISLHEQKFTGNDHA